ncbi:QWRF motif-containing protein 7 [Humulus lupulus]|uniref:QWRF motif-containing protein 7 n=1 Tax=Humulus lupulus TaxID=3486 RepID=UPI002B404635|nr:QWRF motif-containing protein 7 [Humulus lupulus]
METSSYYRRHPSTTPSSPSPRLVRSRSGSSSITSPGGKLTSPSQRLNTIGTTNRSKSTTRTRPPTPNNNYYYKNSTTAASSINSHMQKKPSQEKSDQSSSFTKFLQRSTRGFGSATKAAATGPKPVSGSSSAWALSPARSLPFASTPVAVAPEPFPASARVKTNKSSSSGGVNGVLKYFRPKKVSPVQEEDFHRFRILHNGLLQWRFANATAVAAMAATKHIAESKLFSVWLRIFKMRNSIMEKRIEVQRVKHEIKLYQILNPQICLLSEWAKLEKRNQESVGKLVTKLSGISLQLPLIHGAKADVISIYEAMYTAVDAMDGIEAIITKYFTEVERILYMVTELLITTKQHSDNFEELEKTVTLVNTLLAKETSLRAQHVEAAFESMRCRIC